MSKTRNLQRMLRVAILAMMFGTTAAYAQASKSSQNDSSTQAAGSSSSKSGGQSVNRADQKLMQEMAYSNISEIAASKLALQHSKNDQVKAFAQKMIDDHTQAQQELQQLAQAKGVQLKEEPDAKHKAAAKMLSKLEGDKFDKAYMGQGGLRDHKNTHQLLARAQQKAQDPELKALAAKTMPIVDQHLTMAQDITGSKSFAGMTKKSMSGASSSGSSQSDTGTSGSGSGSSGASTSGSSGSTGSSSGGTSGSSNSTGSSK